MPGFVTVSETRCTPNETFAFIVDLTRWPLFRGYGPLPGIMSASLVEDSTMATGSRVRVTNTDGSVHHEIVEEFEPGRRYRIRMELGSPACYLMERIDEAVDLDATERGTRVTRRFDVTARSVLTAPIAWLFGSVLLRRAVLAHDLAVARALGAKSEPVTST